MNLRHGVWVYALTKGEAMKPLNKRINKRKASKVTLKTHRKHNCQRLNDEMKEIISGNPDIRSEDVKIHQHY